MLLIMESVFLTLLLEVHFYFLSQEQTKSLDDSKKGNCLTGEFFFEEDTKHSHTNILQIIELNELNASHHHTSWK